MDYCLMSQNKDMAMSLGLFLSELNRQISDEAMDIVWKIHDLQEQYNKLVMTALANTSNAEVVSGFLRHNCGDGQWSRIYPYSLATENEKEMLKTIFQRGSFRLLVLDSDEPSSALVVDDMNEEEFKQMYIDATVCPIYLLDKCHTFVIGDCEYCLCECLGEPENGDYIGVALTKYHGNGGTNGIFTVPDTVEVPFDGKAASVRSIGPDAFSESGVKEIVLPRYLDRLCPYAFADSAVERVTFVQRMYDPDHAFRDSDEDLETLDAYGLFYKSPNVKKIIAHDSVIAELKATPNWFMLPKDIEFISTGGDEEDNAAYIDE